MAVATGLAVNVLQTIAIMGMMTVPQLERGWETWVWKLRLLEML